MRFTRSSGILLHPTSLPGPFGSGDLGASSYHFIDWLLSAGQTLWQMLPIGPVGPANSPYMSTSAFAGSALLIDLNELVFRGWIEKDNIPSPQNISGSFVEYSAVSSYRMTMLKKASKYFFSNGDTEDKKTFRSFCEKEASWLDDYAMFQALNWKYKGQEWTSWGTELVRRKPAALKKVQEELGEQIEFQKFVQWCFARQWNDLKKYANDKGVKLVGDIPIYFAQQSADVWSHPEEFHLDEEGEPIAVAGVPPDYFSDEGQRWGNPLYNWDVMKKNNYKLWIERFRRTFELFDILRIDHFRGFESYWEIPADEETAKNGRWVKGPGEDFFNTVKNTLGALPGNGTI
jgi:4-alpha-glucanotransferase